jgi:hypothetical protein
MVWEAKGTRGLPLSVWCTFYRQKVSVVLKHTQMIFILRHVAIGEGSSRLGNLSSGPLLFLFDIAYHNMRGFKSLMFSLWFCPLRWVFVFLDVDPPILFLVLSLFWVLWFIYNWQGFYLGTYRPGWNNTYNHGMKEGACSPNGCLVWVRLWTGEHMDEYLW